MVKVYIIESERGWGQRVDEVKQFPSHKKAEVFVHSYNKKYNPPRTQVPDWYMYAVIERNKEAQNGTERNQRN